MEKKLKIILGVLVILLCYGGLTKATIVDISVATNKPIYQLGEYVTVSITAYNPNPQPVTLNGGIPLASYVMDGVYNWADWHTSPLQVIVSKTIQPNQSFTWNLTHDAQEMQRYPFDIGVHTVVGKVMAFEIIGDNQSSPLQFEVIPEPSAFAILSFALPIFRYLTRRKI
ncbi:MAG: hypothetical protein WC770_08475 [Phycisphaerae bacterium]|jgi:hypothetical protein